jgi:hypothetical protein
VRNPREKPVSTLEVDEVVAQTNFRSGFIAMQAWTGARGFPLDFTMFEKEPAPA